MILRIWIASLALAVVSRAATITNGGFEDGLAHWRPLWTREAKAGTLTLDAASAHGGRSSARVEHTGARDWSLEPVNRVPVQAGDVLELEAWLKLESRGGSVTLCAATFDSAGNAVDWAYASRTLPRTSGWERLHTRLVVPAGVTQLQPRIIGDGAATVWVDDFSGEARGNTRTLRAAGLVPALTLTNATLEVVLDTSQATFSVLDRRTGQRTHQIPRASNLLLTDASARDGQINLTLLDVPSGLWLAGCLRLEADRPEFTFELSGQGELVNSLEFPHPFAAPGGDYLVVPMNEGISYPVADASIEPVRLVAYGGHGICMAFWGATDGVRGHMAILETPDDAAIRIARHEGLLHIAPQWEAQRGAFGYPRRLRYVFLDRGGHVAIAKRYRAYAQQLGLLKTLEQKRRENPNVDRLIGAVNIWCWDRDAVPLVREIQAAGIERILWSNQQSPTNLVLLNDLGVLTSRYDIYQDVMDPDNFPRLSWKHPDWTTKAWPGDIITNASGQFLKGWGVEARDGSMISCGIICDRRALDYARERIPADLATHPYRCRFIDTTTAAPWHECYSAAHPMTRSESREWKMKLLDYVSRDNRLVTGCETGHDAAVPFLHYFEGMLSLGPYRVRDSGRRMQVIWTNVPEAVAKFQLGHAYRLPLWELVYHDCVVAQWYWGDYNNKLPALWDKRDLFNALYGTPAMFMFDRRLWEQNKERFVRSYRNTCPTVRRVGYSEMTDHRFLKADRSVQQTSFANGVTVTVNFGASAFSLPDGALLEPMGFRVN
jgi:hypothetical protein